MTWESKIPFGTILVRVRSFVYRGRRKGLFCVRNLLCISLEDLGKKIRFYNREPRLLEGLLFLRLD